MSGSGKSYSRQAIEFAVGVLAVVWLLRTAWELLRPLLPVIVGFAVVGVTLIAIVRAAMRRREYW